MTTAQQYIQHFNMKPHPEGGYYAEAFQSAEWITGEALPARFGGPRKLYSAILYLLEEGDFSAFHRLQSDECWHFYAGGSLRLLIIDPQGVLQTVILGNDLSGNNHFQFVVSAGCWFAARPEPGSGYTLAGCTLAPGFSYEDFELAERAALMNQFPQHAGIILQLTR